MKKNLKYLLLLSLLSFMACNGDEKIDSGMVQQDGEALQLNVRVGDFAINDISNIRVTDSGSATTFENGDRIGVIVLDADNNELSDNIPYKYDGSIWSFDSSNGEGKTAIYYDNKATVYFAYFPYSKEADNVINIDGLKGIFLPEGDQRSKDAYRASDLLVWSDTSGRPLKKLDILFEHAYSLLSLSPSIKCKINGRRDFTYVPSSISDVSFNIGTESLFPYQVNDGSYQVIISPKRAKVHWLYEYNKEMYSGAMPYTDLSANTCYTFTPILKDIGDYTLDKVQMGDFYCKDESNNGYLIPGDVTALSADMDCLGIVLKSGKDSGGEWVDYCKYKQKDGITEMHTVHGYVLALYDANGGNACTWGLWSLAAIDSGEPSIGFYGYKNTQRIISFAESENRTLKDVFPTVYWITDGTEGYEYSYPAPANSSGWFLPSLGQCWYWMYNKANLLSAIKKATGDNDYGWKLGYWSSSEDGYDPFLNAYYADTYVGAMDWDYKISKLYVRACLVF